MSPIACCEPDRPPDVKWVLYLKDVAVYDKGCATFNLTAETEFSDLNSNFAFLKARKGRILEVMFRKSG